MVLSRRSGVKAFYNNKEVELSNELSSLTIIDNLSGTIDSIEMVLKNDKNKLLKEENELSIGEQVSLEFWTQNWESIEEGIKTYKLGTYYIDDRSFDNETGRFKALSIPLGESQDEVSTKTWNEISLKSLNDEFAKKFKITSFFKSAYNPTLTDIKQENETGLSFLKKIAEQEGLNFKVNVNKIIMFNIEEYEQKISVFTVDLNHYAYNFSEETKNLYTKVNIKYTRSKFMDEENVIYSLEDFGIKLPGKVKEKVLKINAKSKSNNLKKLAKTRLFKENRGRITLDITIVEKIDLYSGDVINVVNAGIYDGRYMIQKTVKSLPGLSVKVSAYKIWLQEGE